MFHDTNFEGDFCTSGTYALPAPGLKIGLFGPVPLPMNTSTLALLETESVQGYTAPAPRFDRLEFDPTAILTTNPNWEPAFQALLAQVADKLGKTTADFDCKMVKLIVEKQGASFDRNQYLSSVSNTFALLEVQFPSVFSGGAHIIRHAGIERTFLVGAEDGSSAHDFMFISRFLDCEHHVQNITQGCRLIAVHSLAWKGSGNPPGAPPMETVVNLARTIFTADAPKGLYLMHNPNNVNLCLGRHGFSCLPEESRKLSNLLAAVSAHMAHASPPDELVLHISTAAVIVHDDETLNAALDMARPICCPDGAGAGALARAILSSFEIPEDTIVLPREGPDDDDSLPQRNEQGVNVQDGWWHTDPAKSWDRGYAFQETSALPPP